MTNSIAIGLAAVILGFIAVDIVLFDTQNLLFLAKKMWDMGEWMAFWR